MDFELSEEHKMFQEAIRNFAQKEIAPLVEEAEKTATFPLQLFPQMGKLGYICVRYPAKYGGAEIGKVGDCISVEEVAYQSVGICAGTMVQSGIGTTAVYSYGSEDQKQKYLVPAIKGEKIAAFGLTEPNAGSDAAAIETTATKKNGKYVINGTKIFITNGNICDFVLAAAYTDKSKGARGGVSLFIVEKGTPGFNRSKLHKFCGRSGETGELSFEDCAVPEENLIGEEGKGFPYLMESLMGGRISHASRSLGLARSAYDATLKYAQERVQFGQPIAKFQANSFKLARMAMDIEAARWLIFHAAWLYDQNKPHVKEAAMAKLFASEVAVSVTTEAMQIHGGYGLTEESVIQRYFRDSRMSTITEGTSEIQQLVISREIGIR
ncbi:MAG: acyl-CoA dehydrogenase family protein [Chloroflexota bacterium]|nr:MAG: acyl-CoA dehydrogenase family protein [Chloroflexota bacterium]